MLLTAGTTTATVEIPAGSLSDPAAVLTVTRMSPSQDTRALFGDAVSAAGDAIQANLSAGGLIGPAKVRFALPADFDATRYVPGVLWEGDDGTPELIASTWAPGDMHVTATTRHFSIGWPIKIDVSKIASGIGDFVKNLVSGRAGSDNPACMDEFAARKGLEVISDSGDLVKWCVGVEGGRPVVKVTNNWRAGMQVSFPKSWNVLEYQGEGFDLQSLGDWLDSKSRETSSTRSRLVGPGQTIVLAPGSLAGGSTGRVVAEASTVSWLWSITLTAVDRYLLTVGKLARLRDDVKAEDLVVGASFIKCFTDYYGEDINILDPIRDSSTLNTITTATKFALDCGKDIIQDAVRGRGGLLGRIGAAVVGVLAEAVGVAYGLVNALFSGIRSVIDEIGALFDGSEVGGYGYDILLTGVASTPPATTVSASIPIETIQLYLNMLSYGPLDEDGILGPASTSAIQTFQTDNGLVATGQPDSATVEALINRAGDFTFLVDGCGSQMPARSDSLYLSCSLSSGLVDLQWQTWNAQRAQGTGRMFARDCDAGCINGEPQYVDITVEAYEPERWRCGDGAPFQLFTFSIVESNGESWGEYRPIDFSC